MTYKVYLSTIIKPSKLAKGTGIIVIEPDDYTASEVKAIKNKGYKVLAYLSVGTIEKERSFYKKYKKYGLKPLKDWPDEVYADVTRTAWRTFLVDRAKALKKKGFDGFWCDNVDVYEYYKSSKMFAAVKAVLKQIKAVGGYVMINGGQVFLRDCFSKGVTVKDFINGYTQEEVFSRIVSYKGKGTFRKQSKGETEQYQTTIIKSQGAGLDCFLLEYSTSKDVISLIEIWCETHKVSYYISKDVNL